MVIKKEQAAELFGVRLSYFIQRISSKLTNIGHGLEKEYDKQEIEALKKKLKELKLQKGPKNHL